MGIHAEGPEADLEAFAEWLRQGPPGARVTEVVLGYAPATGYFAGFSVDY